MKGANKRDRGERGVKIILKIKIKNEFVDFITDGRFPKNIGLERTVRSPIQTNKNPLGTSG